MLFGLMKTSDFFRPTQLAEHEPAGDDFLAHVAINWEQEAQTAEPLGVRVVRLRTGAAQWIQPSKAVHFCVSFTVCV